jgi:hypothetical protein
MTDPAFAVWHVSGGPASRAYAEVFLRHGVALIGPGDAGLWNPECDDDELGGVANCRLSAERKSEMIDDLRGESE